MSQEPPGSTRIKSIKVLVRFPPTFYSMDVISTTHRLVYTSETAGPPRRRPRPVHTLCHSPGCDTMSAVLPGSLQTLLDQTLGACFIGECCIFPCNVDDWIKRCCTYCRLSLHSHVRWAAELSGRDADHGIAFTGSHAFRHTFTSRRMRVTRYYWN